MMNLGSFTNDGSYCTFFRCHLLNDSSSFLVPAPIWFSFWHERGRMPPRLSFHIVEHLMKKILLIMLLLLLVACGGAAETAVNEEQAVAAAPTNAPTAAPTDTPMPTAAPVEEVAEEEAVAEETAVDAPAIPFEELLADASSVRTNDWVKGTNDPLITIIEYGDFQ
jgi:hypothetical protein